MKRIVETIIQSNISMHQSILKNEELLEAIVETANCAISTIENGNKILICGNGGSAADAQHMAAELVGRFQRERKGIAAIALNTDTSIITAWANDYDYDSVFQRQVEALGKKGDMLIGISTSGNSKNILQAVEFANENKIQTVGLLGKDGGILGKKCDKSVIMPEGCTARIQEAHITVIHIICQLIEDAMYHEK